VHHLSPSESTKRDPDIVSGMLTAVQDFVHDAFVYGEKKRSLKKLDFGEYSIIIRRGEHLYFAAVIRGRDTPRLRELMEDTLHDLEDRFGPRLRDWEGDEAALQQVREYLGKKFKTKARAE
jgi:OOP family OmpA-OmpF porin